MFMAMHKNTAPIKVFINFNTNFSNPVTHEMRRSFYFLYSTRECGDFGKEKHAEREKRYSDYPKYEMGVWMMEHGLIFSPKDLQYIYDH